MARVTIEDCLDKVESRFALVHLAVRRVLQLRSGSPPLVNAPKNKEIVLALREIAAGKVTPDNIRQLEDSKVRAETGTVEREDVALREVKEILDAATQYDASREYGQADSFLEPDEDEL
ncbi:MAG: DNA-directed RNA polymerase subunit omega [Syntrophobacteraceae bacterium]|nr:DNA-directed RNA polymerase subunit omega [Syntrophobacteraceae bacterium]